MKPNGNCEVNVYLCRVFYVGLRGIELRINYMANENTNDLGIRWEYRRLSRECYFKLENVKKCINR